MITVERGERLNDDKKISEVGTINNFMTDRVTEKCNNYMVMNSAQFKEFICSIAYFNNTFFKLQPFCADRLL